MAVLSLPLSFTNSFWSQEYRKGLEVLYSKLEQGTEENEQIVTFIRARATAESQLAAALTNPTLTGPAGSGFGKDDGASLFMAFRGLQAESANQGQAHATVAKELNSLVADPFEQWALAHKDRLEQSRENIVDGYLKAYEQAQSNLARMKHEYHEKVRKADEAADDAKFAPNSAKAVDNYTTSPRMRPLDAPHTPRAPPQRTPSVSERIANRLKELQKRSAGALASAAAGAGENDKLDETVFDTPTSPEATPVAEKQDKGKAKEVDAPAPVTSSPLTLSPSQTPTALRPVSPLPIPASPIPLGPDDKLPPQAISALLTRAAAELRLRPVRFPLLGEYPNCFTGEEFVDWLLSNVESFGGDWEKADDAARNLTEKEGLLRRVGELGNAWEPAYDAWYQFRPKAFELGRSPSQAESDKAPTSPSTTGGRITSFASLVSKALTQANSEPSHTRAAQDADAADAAYKLAARRLDRQRLGLEERIEDTLKSLQRLEMDRLNAVKTCLLQFQGTLSNLPSALSPSLDRSSTLITAFQPQNDLTALIERYRTGPFRPRPVLYESVAHDERDVLFGGDLRKWSEAVSGSWSSQMQAINNGSEPAKKDIVPIPLVLERLLEGLDEVYKKVTDHGEKRKAWIYEVPLPASHHLRERLNASIVPPDPAAPDSEGTTQTDIPLSLITQYDAPVIASTIKLWLLELDPPIGLWEGWDEFRKIYPHVGSALDDEKKQARIESISSALLKLPKIHLQVLDRVASYLVRLIESTSTEESNEVYVNKLSLSIGRTIVRPRVETELSIQDRHPTLLFIDLLQSYSQILPPTLTKKKRESERKVPIRKRTAMVDMRLSRSKMLLGAGEEEQKRMLHAQHVRQNPSISRRGNGPPPVPALPKDVQEAKKASLPPAPSPPIVSEKITEEPPEFKDPPPEPAEETPQPPAFKDPPPEPADDASQPPVFKEPPPEPADDGVPPMPEFKDPPPEPPSPTSASPQEENKVDENKPVAAAKAALARNTSGGAVRGPRVAARGPRAPNSPTGSRPSSVLGRASAFERRTMESDAEDNVVNGS